MAHVILLRQEDKKAPVLWPSSAAADSTRSQALALLSSQEARALLVPPLPWETDACPAVQRRTREYSSALSFHK